MSHRAALTAANGVKLWTRNVMVHGNGAWHDFAMRFEDDVERQKSNRKSNRADETPAMQTAKQNF